MMMPEAVSLVLKFHNEIFTIKRQDFLPAFPGYLAFVGGKIEKKDKESSNQLIPGLPEGHANAIIRELIEEIHFDLNHWKSKFSIRLLGIAITPDFNPYRFATYFYEITLDQKHSFELNSNEIESGHWKTPENLIELYLQANCLVIPPILKIFELYAKKHLDYPVDLNFQYDILPVLETVKGVKQIFVKSHTLPPAIYTNCFIIGDQLAIAVDPSPIDLDEYAKVKTLLKRYNVKKIFLTHHHPDHCEYSHQLALELSVPLLMSQNTYQDLYRKNNAFFDHVQVQIIGHLDLVTYSRNLPVLAYAIPGHDHGQLALFCSDLSWFIAGDLFQGQGTVVIGEPEGDMAEYFKTLNDVIELNPKFLYPSHGIVLGGTKVLKKTLKHRQERENQVISLLKEGKNIDQMFDVIYPDLDHKLKKYALKNISSHIKKIKSEKLI